ncbi:hypothetical protein ISS42_02175 [Candidatus Shapirobacteria bacterium]|nr:hypothetical protein [Candidatus Shapirobacteria bacterium]
MKKKHLLTISVLALLITGLSWFHKKYISGTVFAHGLPLEFLRISEWAGRTEFFWKPQRLLFDIFFWFLFFVAPCFSIFLKDRKWLRVFILLFSSIFISIGLNIILEKFVGYHRFISQFIYFIPEFIRKTAGLGGLVPSEFFEIFGLFLNKVLVIPIIFLLLILFPSFRGCFDRLIYIFSRSKLLKVLVAVILILGVFALFGFKYWYQHKERASFPQPPSGQKEEIVRIKFLHTSGGMLPPLAEKIMPGKSEQEFYEVNLRDHIYKSDSGVIIEKKLINQLEEALKDRQETDGFHTAPQMIIDVFSNYAAEILFGDGRRVILRSDSAGVPLWNILDEGQFYIQISGRIPNALLAIKAEAKGKEPKEIRDKTEFDTSFLEDLGKGKIPDEVTGEYLGLFEFNEISWGAYKEVPWAEETGEFVGPYFTLFFRKKEGLEIKRAELEINKKKYPCTIPSSDRGIQIEAKLSQEFSSVGSPFKAKLNIWYEKEGKPYSTDGILNGFWQNSSTDPWGEDTKPRGITYQISAPSWIKSWKPVLRIDEPFEKRKGDVIIELVKPTRGEVEQILVDDCGGCIVAKTVNPDSLLALPCNTEIFEDKAIVNCVVPSSARGHSPGSPVELGIAVTTEVEKSRSTKSAVLKGVWLKDVDENMGNYFRIFHRVVGFLGFRMEKTSLVGNKVEVKLTPQRDIEIVRIAGEVSKKKIQAGEETIFTFNLEGVDESFNYQEIGLGFIYRDSDDKFTHQTGGLLIKYGVEKESSYSQSCDWDGDCTISCPAGTTAQCRIGFCECWPENKE